MRTPKVIKNFLIKIHNRLHELQAHEEKVESNAGFKYFGLDSYIEIPNIVRGKDFIEIGDHVYIGAYSRIEAITDYLDGEQKFIPVLKIGSGSSIQLFCHIGANHRIIIGSNVMIAGSVYITDHLHRYDNLDLPVALQQITDNSEVIIEDDCFIGEGAAILPNVHLGKHCIVGANAVVTHSFPAYSVVAGVPARLVRTLE